MPLPLPDRERQRRAGSRAGQLGISGATAQDVARSVLTATVDRAASSSPDYWPDPQDPGVSYQVQVESPLSGFMNSTNQGHRDHSQSSARRARTRQVLHQAASRAVKRGTVPGQNWTATT